MSSQNSGERKPNTFVRVFQQQHDIVYLDELVEKVNSAIEEMRKVVSLPNGPGKDLAIARTLTTMSQMQVHLCDLCYGDVEITPPCQNEEESKQRMYEEKKRKSDQMIEDWITPFYYDKDGKPIDPRTKYGPHPKTPEHAARFKVAMDHYRKELKKWEERGCTPPSPKQ